MPSRLLFGAPTARLNSARPNPSSERVNASSAATTRAEERPDDPSAGSAASAGLRDRVDRGKVLSQRSCARDQEEGRQIRRCKHGTQWSADAAYPGCYTFPSLA